MVDIVFLTVKVAVQRSAAVLMAVDVTIGKVVSPLFRTIQSIPVTMNVEFIHSHLEFLLSAVPGLAVSL